MASAIRCRLVYSIAPGRTDVKGGGFTAVHWSTAHRCAETLDLRSWLVLIGHPILEINCQLCVNLAPILPAARPLFRDVQHSQIQHFQQAVIRGEHGFGFRDLPELTVEALNRICGVNQRFWGNLK